MRILKKKSECSLYVNSATTDSVELHVKLYKIYKNDSSKIY
jgi:hypothetical protein